MTKHRLLCAWGLLCCLASCSESAPIDQGSFFGPHTDDDDEMDGGAADAGEDPGQRADAGLDPADAAPPHSDGGSGESDAGPSPGDASTHDPDAASPADAGATDAGVPQDASSEADASSEDGGALDASQPDAGAEDGGTVEPDAGQRCGTDGLVAGNSCVGVVTCQDNNFSGDPVLECVLLESGVRRNRCCTATFASNSCRASACGGGDDEAQCDGPEDCGGSAASCCFDAGATSCASSCAAAQTLCHTDADCPAGRRCEAGTASGQYSWWGFCAG